MLPVHAGDPVADAEASWRDVHLDGCTLRFARPLALDLGGIAKGYAVDRAVAAMQAAGAAAGLVNAGGDLAGFGADWPVTLVDPRTRAPAAAVVLRDEALATSAGVRGGGALRDRRLRGHGGSWRGSRGGGLDFAHLPGRAPGRTSATVAAPRCLDADALAKLVIADHPLAAACLAHAGARVVAVSRTPARQAA